MLIRKLCRYAASAVLLAGMTVGVTGCGEKVPETPEEFHAAMVERSVVRTGNTARLNQVFDRAANGEDITIAYVGGSITEGYAAGVHSPKCYASVSAADFETNYCNGGKVICQNNGLSGTPSVLGNLRVREEVLPSEPDIIFLEFAVNDGQTNECKVSYESLVRSCLEAPNEPAVILLFTYMENGHTCQEQQEEIGAHYDLGMISVRDAIVPEMEASRMSWSDYGDDDVHPTVAGHALLGAFIGEYFSQAKAKKADKQYSLPADTVYPALYDDAALYDAANIKYREGSWFVGTSNQRFPTGFVHHAEMGGNDPLCMTVTGKTLFLVYKTSSDQTYGMAGVYINGHLAGIANGYGINAWGGPTVLEIENYEQSQEMNVEIKMLDDHVDKQFEIYALGVSQ